MISFIDLRDRVSNFLDSHTGWSLNGVAKASGVPQPTLWGFMNGRSKSINMDHVEKLMAFLGNFGTEEQTSTEGSELSEWKELALHYKKLYHECRQELNTIKTKKSAGDTNRGR